MSATMNMKNVNIICLQIAFKWVKDSFEGKSTLNDEMLIAFCAIYTVWIRHRTPNMKKQNCSCHRYNQIWINHYTKLKRSDSTVCVVYREFTRNWNIAISTVWINFIHVCRVTFFIIFCSSTRKRNKSSCFFPSIIIPIRNCNMFYY